MTDRQLRDECVTLFLAGHETTAQALTFAFYLLCQNAEVADRLAAELDAVLDGRPPAVADVPNLVYTQAVVRDDAALSSRLGHRPTSGGGFRNWAATS